MERWMIALIVCGAVTIGMALQAWTSWLEHKRRTQAMDVIKAALEAGKEPPPALYQLIDQPQAKQQKRPWNEVIVFTALGAGFWFAYFQAEAEQQDAFMFVASVMSITAIVCLALALKPDGGRDDAGQ